MNIFKIIKQKKDEFKTQIEFKATEQHKKNMEELKQLQTKQKLEQTKIDIISQRKQTKQKLTELRHPTLTKLTKKVKANLKEARKNKTGIYSKENISSTFNNNFDTDSPFRSFSENNPFNINSKKKKKGGNNPFNFN